VSVCGPVSPVIVSAASDEVVVDGQSVTLSCQTSAVPPVAVVWRHNAQPVHANHRTHVTGTLFIIIVIIVSVIKRTGDELFLRATAVPAGTAESAY